MKEALHRFDLDAAVEVEVSTDFVAPDGDGSDHGWGAHHFTLGGAVNGYVWRRGTAKPVPAASTPAKLGS